MLLLLICLLAVAIVLLISPVEVWLDYRHRGKTEDSLLIQVGVLWGARRFSIQVPVISSSREGVSLQAEAGKKKKRLKLPSPSVQTVRQLMSVARAAKGIIKKIFSLFRRGVIIKQFIWHTEIGLNDSARLAQITGGLWAVKGMVAAGLNNLFRFLRPPLLRVRPHFNQTYFRAVFSCILEFPLGYAIIAAFYIVFVVIKLKLFKRGVENVGTSNPRPDEDSHGEHQGNGGCQYCDR